MKRCRAQGCRQCNARQSRDHHSASALVTPASDHASKLQLPAFESSCVLTFSAVGLSTWACTLQLLCLHGRQKACTLQLLCLHGRQKACTLQLLCLHGRHLHSSCMWWAPQLTHVVSTMWLAQQLAHVVSTMWLAQQLAHMMGSTACACRDRHVVCAMW